MSNINSLPKKMKTEDLANVLNNTEDKFTNKNFSKISTWFHVYKDNWSPGNIINLRISNIYDPSKFWIVTRHRELDSFQMYLSSVYDATYESLQIPSEEIKVGLYCIVYIYNGYYRSVVVCCPPSYRQPRTVRVFCIDYGTIDTVSEDCLFYLNENCKILPQFAVRASLAKICPHNSERWTQQHVNRFRELITYKILEGLIINIDYEREILNIHLAEVDFVDNSLLEIHKILINEKIAEYAKIKKDVNIDNRILVKYMYLFPSFELLESGRVLCDVAQSEYLLKIYSPDILYDNYYSKNENV